MKPSQTTLGAALALLVTLQATAADQPIPTAADIVGPDGIVYPDFSRAGIPGGIPDVETVVNAADHGAVPDDDQDDSAAINAAIEAAAGAGGGAVLLKAGRYQVDSTILISRSGVVLRGEDRERTVLVPRFANARKGDETPWTVRLDPGENDRRYDVALTAPLRRGQTEIPVPESSRYEVGDIVVLSARPPLAVVAQLNDEGKQHIDEGSWGAIYSWQHLRIAEILPDAIRVDRPLRLDLPLEQQPRLGRMRTLVGSGIETLTIAQDVERKAIHGIGFANAERCWMRGVTILRIGNWPLSVGRSFECEIRDSHLDESRSFGGAQAYIGVGFATDNLFADLRITRFRHLSVSMASNGNVFRDCFFENVDVNFHMHWPYENLFDNCHIDATTGPDATEETKNHGSYGYGFYLPDHAGGGHNPAGPRNTFYHNRFITSRDGMILGGGGAKRTLVAYNRFDVQHSSAAVVKPGNEQTLVIGNVFVLRDPNRRVGGNIYGIDEPGRMIGAVLFPEGPSEGLGFVDNVFYGAPQGQLFAGAGPAFTEGNEARADWPREPGAALPGTLSLAGPWRVKVVQALPAAPSPDQRHADPGPSASAQALLDTDVGDADWTQLHMPQPFGEDLPGWGRSDGEVVARLHFDLPTELLDQELTLSLGTLDDSDETWINGRRVGATTGPDAWSQVRLYTVPAGLLRAQGNVLAVRIWDAFGGGGMMGIDEDLWIGRPSVPADGHLPQVIVGPTPPVPSLHVWQVQQRASRP